MDGIFFPIQKMHVDFVKGSGEINWWLRFERNHSFTVRKGRRRIKVNPSTGQVRRRIKVNPCIGQVIWPCVRTIQ